MQLIPANLTTIIASDIKKPNCQIKIAWDLSTYDIGADFGVVGTSTVGGTDVVQGEGSYITRWQKYYFTDESEYLKGWEYTKEAEYPFMGVIKSRASVVLDNHDKHFFPTIYPYNVKQGRLIRLFDGYNGYFIPQFVGVADKPVNNIKTMETTIEAYDVLTYLENFEMAGAVYENMMRSDIVIAILEEAGFGDTEYFVDNSEGSCDLVWIEKGEKALDIIRDICQAEDARFYADEEGYLRWESRYHLAKLPHNGSVYTFNYDNNIFSVELNKDNIINKGICEIKPRRWAEPDKIFELSGSQENVIIQAGETIEIYADYKLPIKDVTQPTDGGTKSFYTANSQADGQGTDLTADIGITAFATYSTISFVQITNSGGSTAYLTGLTIWGTPAKESDPIIYKTDDTLATDSIAEYGIKEYELKNNRFINTLIEAKGLMDWLVWANKDSMNTLNLEVDGIVQLQIGDRVSVVEETTGETLSMVVFKIEKTGNELKYNLFLAEKITQYEDGIEYAVVGTSTVDGLDKLGR